jgi:hypothetical protein
VETRYDHETNKYLAGVVRPEASRPSSPSSYGEARIVLERLSLASTDGV